MTRRSTLFRTAAVATAIVLPALAIGGVAWSASARTDAVDRIPVAIVNDDQIVQAPKTVAAGRELSSALVHPTGTESVQLDWTLASGDDARDGLQDGTYQAVLTIPKDFSADVASSGTDDPKHAQVSLQTSADASATGAVSAVIANAASDALGEQITTQYVDSTLDGYTSLHSSLSSAAGSASSLTDGATSVSEGTAQLVTASGNLASGLAESASGASALASGASGASASAKTVADGSSQVAAGADGVSAAAATVADATERTAAGASSLATSLQAASAQCRTAPAALPLCTQLASAAQAAAQLDTGASTTAAGAASLADGAASLDGAASQVASGAGSLASGVGTLASSSDQLASGIEQATSGAQQLTASASTLADGAATVTNGSAQLTSGLEDAVQQVPAYSDDEKKTITSVVSDPVDVHQETSGTDGAVAALLGIGAPALLWLAAIATGTPALRRRGDLADVPTGALLRRHLLVPLGLAVVQGVAASLALLLAGVDAGNAAGLGGLMVLGAVTFAAIATAVRTWFPRAATTVLLAALVLQTLCSGVVLPLVTAPQPLHFLGSILPVDTFGSAAVQLIVGGDGPSAVPVVVSLVLWAALGVAFATLGAFRARRVGGRDRTARARPALERAVA